MIGDSESELIDQYGSETFKAVHDSDQDGLIYFAGDGTIEYLNRAALELFQTESKIIGENIFELLEENPDELPVELIHPSDHFEKARKTYETGAPTRTEMVVVDGDERRNLEVLWGAVEREGTITGVVGSYRDVSPRPDIHDQLASEASRLDEERRFLASIIEVLDDGILVFDGSATLQLANPSALELLGLEAPVEGLELEALLERSLFDTPEHFARQLRRTATSDGSSSEIQHIELEEGGIRQLQVDMTRAEYDRERLICTVSDRTSQMDLRQMELLSELARLDAQGLGFEEFGDRALGLIVEHLRVDFAILTRAEDEQLLPFAWRGVMLDRDMSIDVHRHPPIERLLQERGPERVDDWPWRRHLDDSLEQLIIPLTGPDSRVGTLHLGYGSEVDARRLDFDVLERAFTEALGDLLRRALQEARRTRDSAMEREWLRALIETVPLGVLLYDRRGDVVLHNSAFVEMTRFDDWENLNTDSRPFRLLDSEGEPLPRSEWPLFRVPREGEPCSAELTFDFGYERRDIVVDATPLEGTRAGTELFVGLLRDVTRERRLSRRKDEFLSIASHELRSPLTPLNGILQMARRQRERGSRVDLSLLTRAERQVSRLTRLIDGLLDLTRIETDRMELEVRTVEVTSFIEEQVEPWRLHPKDVSLEVRLPEEDIRAELDPDRINQVLTNVVDNAIEYSQPDGAIFIEVEDSGPEVEIAVQDNGVGMDDETVERIFDRFYHGSGGRAGARNMGLGLYVCRQIVEEHSGEIFVDSEEGEGTRVEIALPKNLPARASDGDDRSAD